MNKKLLNLIECDSILKEIGNSLEKPSTIIAVGGYCMLQLGIRASTVDIDYIPSETEFIVLEKHRDAVNSDVLNIDAVTLDFDVLLPYCSARKRFGNLTVLLANKELLLALKYLASLGRIKERDKVDLIALEKIADKEVAFEVLNLVSVCYIDYETFITDLETEIILFNLEKQKVKEFVATGF